MEKARFHHSAICRGYVKVKDDGYREEYNGKFGWGYIIHHANLRCGVYGRHSTMYHIISYFIYC